MLCRYQRRDFLDGDQLAAGYLPHDCVNLGRGGDYYRAGASIDGSSGRGCVQLWVNPYDLRFAMIVLPIPSGACRG
jgi:hypothetical protein